MRATFPVQFDANLLGKSREAGEFVTSGGDTVSYADAYEFSFENSEGLTQTVRVGVKQIDEAADFDVAKQPKFTAVKVRGDVSLRDGGGSFRPTEIRLAKAA